MEIIDKDGQPLKENDQEAKNRAIIAHITLIGWIIALVMNNNEKREFASFYIRQMLGLILTGVVGALLTLILIGYFIQIAVFVFWIISLIGAVNGEKKELPIVGPLFQDWFRTL